MVVIVSAAGLLTRFGSDTPPAGTAGSPASVVQQAPAANAPAKAATLKLGVIHTHTFRGCPGKLVLTATGLGCVPDKADDEARDGLSLLKASSAGRPARQDLRVAFDLAEGESDDPKL